MINARQALMSAARGFFEREIASIYSWDDVERREAEPSDPEPRSGKPNSRGEIVMRPNRLGKFKERVVLVFDEFRLEVESCEQAPPVGSVKLFAEDKLSAEGPLDESTWAKIGGIIRERCNVVS